MLHVLNPDPVPVHAARPVPASDWRNQAAIVFGLELAHLLFESVRTDHVLNFASLLDWLAFKGDEVIRQSINVVAAVVALQYIDRMGSLRPHRTPAALLSMVAAALAGAALASFFPPTSRWRCGSVRRLRLPSGSGTCGGRTR